MLRYIKSLDEALLAAQLNSYYLKGSIQLTRADEIAYFGSKNFI